MHHSNVVKSPIVSPEWLLDHLHDEELIIFDSSPLNTVTGRVSDFVGQYIPKTRLFDIKNNFTNPDSTFPNTVPNAEQFELECRKLGVNNQSKIIVYDNFGIYTSPRVWWLFQYMGHSDVWVLDGGLPGWADIGGPLVSDLQIKQDIQIGDFISDVRSEYLIDYEEVVRNNERSEFIMLDARSKGRFDGTEQEPRKNLQSGRIPNSMNLPYNHLFDRGRFKSRSELKEIFEKRVERSDKIVYTCGSGMTACIVLLAGRIALYDDMYLYDGSWTEYATKQNLTR